MLRIQTANLPAEQQQRLHSDFVANEQHYLRMRPELLKQYRGQWVAVHDGQVIAHGNNLVTVMNAVGRAGRHAFVALVGREDDVVFRVRRLEFSYDTTYRPLFSTACASLLTARRSRLHLKCEDVFAH